MRGTTASAFSSVCDAVAAMLGMKAAVVAIVALVGSAMSQYQSFYAGGGWAYPGPLPQFTTANAAEGLDNRVGEPTTTTMSPEQSISSQVGGWPVDRQPFWFVNREHIQQHLGRPQPQGTQREAQNPTGTQTQGQDTPRQPQNQPDLPNTSSQAPDTQNQPGIRSQPQDNQFQPQDQPVVDRQFQWWLQNQFFSPQQQRWAQNQPGALPVNTAEVPRWRDRPGTKTAFRRQ